MKSDELTTQIQALNRELELLDHREGEIRNELAARLDIIETDRQRLRTELWRLRSMLPNLERIG